jgi:asparagine synthetase B (glutamine-hydrolysing)
MDLTGDCLFVGEIFNYADFGYESDVDLMSAEHFNIDLLHKMDGFWSFVKIQEDTIFAMTDYLSQKPLYYRTDCEAVASEIDVLKRLGPNTINETFISNTIKWGYSPTPETPYNEIRQIPPGHYLFAGVVTPYWDWSLVADVPLVDALKTSVRHRMGGQQDISILLSGGLDSAIVYGLVKELGYDITAIHVDNGEEDFAKLVCDNLVEVSLNDVSDVDAIRIHQSPVDLGSVKPQIAMARKLKELGFHAVLTGDGADELFGGYTRALTYDSQHSDTFCELPYYHNPKLDRTMMDSTVELRTPFLAATVVKYALGLPYERRNGIKHELKEHFAYMIPQAILDRDKHPLKTNAIRLDPMTQRINNVKLWRELNDRN